MATCFIVGLSFFCNAQSKQETILGYVPSEGYKQVCTDDGIIYIQYSELLGEVCCFKDPNGQNKIEECPEYYPCACETPFNKDAKCLRRYSVKYDNGRTPESSTNTCGSRLNFVSYKWDMEVVYWEVNGTEVGQGHQFLNISGWTPQLQAWSDFFNLYDPNLCTDAQFGVDPAPTWRSSEIIGCLPEATYGVLVLERLSDGCIFTIYPVLETETYERYYTWSTYDCVTETITDHAQQLTKDPDTNEELLIDIDPADIEYLTCLLPCSYKFDDFIQADAVSPCTSELIDKGCDYIDENTQVQLAIVVNYCPDRSVEIYDYNDYINSTDPDLEPYELQGELQNCDGTDFEYPPADLEVIAVGKTEMCHDGQQLVYNILEDNTCVYYQGGVQIFEVDLEPCTCCGKDDDTADPCAFVRCPIGTTPTPNDNGGCDCVPDDNCIDCQVSIENWDASNTVIEKGQYVGGGAVDLFANQSNTNSVVNRLMQMDAECERTCWYMQVSQSQGFTTGYLQTGFVGMQGKPHQLVMV